MGASKRVHGASELTCAAVSPDLCDQIADMRRKLQKIATSRILFLDETALRLNAAPNHTLVLPGEQPFVEATPHAMT